MFDHFVAVDYRLSNIAIARMTKKSNEIKIIDVPSEITEISIRRKFQTVVQNLQ